MPLTIRAAAGAGLGFGCQHSQMLDQWFRGNSGLSLVVPPTHSRCTACLEVQSEVTILLLF